MLSFNQTINWQSNSQTGMDEANVCRRLSGRQVMCLAKPLLPLVPWCEDRGGHDLGVLLVLQLQNCVFKQSPAHTEVNVAYPWQAPRERCKWTPLLQ